MSEQYPTEAKLEADEFRRRCDECKGDELELLRLLEAEVRRTGWKLLRLQPPLEQLSVALEMFRRYAEWEDYAHPERGG